MSRRLKILVALCLVLALLIGALLWALPEIVRRVAVGKLTELSGRQTSIERVELNLFTGPLRRQPPPDGATAGPWTRGLCRVRPPRRPGGAPDALRLRHQSDRAEPRAAGRAHHAHRAARLRFCRSARSSSPRRSWTPGPAASRSRWAGSRHGGHGGHGRSFLSPAVRWRIEPLDIEASGITTKPDQPPGGLRISARLGDARLETTSRSVNLTPPSISLDVALTDFDLARARPTCHPTSRSFLETGKLGLTLKFERVRAGDALGESSMSGEVKLEALSVVQRDRPAPFLTADRLTVPIERMDFLARRRAARRRRDT